MNISNPNIFFCCSTGCKDEDPLQSFYDGLNKILFTLWGN